MNAKSSALSSPPNSAGSAAGRPWRRTAAFVVGLVAAGFGAALQAAPAPQPALGANVNETLVSLEPTLLQRAHVTWVRGFVPASEFLDGGRRFDTDPGLRAMRTAADAGSHVILTIKWNLAKPGRRVPAPGSAEETRWFEFAAGLAHSMAGRLDILGLVNEVFIDTQPEDLVAPKGGDAPMVVFLERLAAYLHAAKLEGRGGAPVALYAGGFTRLDLPRMQQSPTVAALANWLNTCPYIAGVDLHLHQANYEQMRDALAFLRRAIPNKPFIVTEFSLIWQFKPHMKEPLGATPAGRAFAEKYGFAADQPFYEVVNAALEHPMPQAEWQALLASRPWFDPQFLSHACGLMAERGVIVATYGFSQGSPEVKRYPRQSATSVPWLLNPIYVQQVAVSGTSNTAAVNYGLFDDFVRLQRPAQTP